MTAEGTGAIHEALSLVSIYHESARAELIARIGHRDTSIALFLAATAVIVGAAFGSSGLDDDGAALLLILPLLGLGATFVHVQHNGVTGTLGVYLGSELRDQTLALLDAAGLPRNLAPSDWDSSTTLFELRSHPISRRWSALILLATPQGVAVALATLELPPNAMSVIGVVLGILAIALTCWLVEKSHRDRQHNTARLRSRKTGEAEVAVDAPPTGSI